MRIRSARIKSYRTIKDDFDFEVTPNITLVGPNNSGKTNLVKGLRLFFGGYDNALGYHRSSDLSIGQSRSQTTVSVTFSGDSDGRDKEIYETLDAIHTLLGTSRGESEDFTLYLVFSFNSTPAYRAFPNARRPNDNGQKTQYSRLERKLVNSVLSQFSVHYIPSDKSIFDLYRELVQPFLLRQSFRALEPHLGVIEQVLEQTAGSINLSLSRVGLGQLTCAFKLPTTPEKMLRELQFNIKDPNDTSIFSKGMGVQSAVLLAAFNWITREESSADKAVVWLLEEPESYLHPELATQCNRLIAELRQHAQVICTTHSLAFVPQDPRDIVGVELRNGWTEKRQYRTYHEATDRIRRSLGVKFSDYYNLAKYNIFVEGETDREYIKAIAGILFKDNQEKIKHPILSSDDVAIMDFGGVTGLEGFVKATYEFVRSERACFVVFDGDEAGDRCRRNLQGFLGNKGLHIQANKHFVSVRSGFPIEGLFPDAWIKECHAQHPGWFSSYSVDAEDVLQPFNLKDDHKRSYLDYMIGKANAAPASEWANKWLNVFGVIEKALQAEAKRIYGIDLTPIIAAPAPVPTSLTDTQNEPDNVGVDTSGETAEASSSVDQSIPVEEQDSNPEEPATPLS
jgi:Predicted ATP-dependent endonuclease of the OLD family